MMIYQDLQQAGLFLFGNFISISLVMIVAASIIDAVLQIIDNLREQRF